MSIEDIETEDETTEDTEDTEDEIEEILDEEDATTEEGTNGLTYKQVFEAFQDDQIYLYGYLTSIASELQGVAMRLGESPTPLSRNRRAFVSHPYQNCGRMIQAMLEAVTRLAGEQNPLPNSMWWRNGKIRFYRTVAKITDLPQKRMTKVEESRFLLGWVGGSSYVSYLRWRHSQNISFGPKETVAAE